MSEKGHKSSLRPGLGSSKAAPKKALAAPDAKPGKRPRGSTRKAIIDYPGLDPYRKAGRPRMRAATAGIARIAREETAHLADPRKEFKGGAELSGSKNRP